MQEARRRWRASYGVWPLLLVIAFLLGRRFAETPAPPECPPAPVCLPAPEVAAPPPPPKRPERVKAKQLPPDDLSRQPHREALLAWVRSRSPAWSGCVPRGNQPIDVAVTAEVAEDGRIEEVHISADGALTPEQRACLEGQIATQSLPAELCRGGQRLLFGLRI